MTNFNVTNNSGNLVSFPGEVSNFESLLPNLDSILEQALENTSQYLSNFRFDARYTQKLETAFGNNFNLSVANQIFDKLAQGDFSDVPTIEIVNRNDINGANGAFAIATGKIYLAADFINQNAQNRDAIVAVLLEEYGHYVDSQINTTDAAGDEGDVFARLVQGKSLSESELAVLKAEDDSATVTVDGQVVEIEMNAQATSQFITLAKPTTESKTIVGYGSNQEDIIQLQSYKTTDAGLIQKVWGYSGADIFNVNFELPGDGKVGIDFNTGNLKKLAQMLVEPDWDVRAKRIAMDTTAAIVSAKIDYATSVASSAASSIPFAGGSISAGIEAAGIAANLAVDLGNIAANAELDIEEWKNNLAGIDNFFADQNNQNWGTVNIFDARTVVEIRDFEPGVDVITLPKLPTNWTWKIGSGTFGDTGKNYVSVSFANGTNASGEILRIGFNDELSKQITGSKQDLISDLLTLSNSGWAIGDTIKEEKSTSDSILNGTIANDVLSIKNDNQHEKVTLSGGDGDDVLIGRINGNDALYGGNGNDYIAPGTGSDTINGGAGYDQVDYSNLTTGVNVTSSRFTSIEGVVGTNYQDVIDLSSLTVTNSDNLVTGLISIKGNGGNDSLTGSQYSDLLDGGTGNDTLIGKNGDDIYIVDNVNDVVTETSGQGNDTIKSSVTFSLSNNVENLTLTDKAAINGTGNAANNIIIGNTANNKLDALAGNDTLLGGLGNDTLFGGSGNDVLFGDFKPLEFNSTLSYYNGSKYLLTATGTWEQAQAEAKNLGGNLVTINSQEEQDWLFQTFGGQQYWIGFTDKETEQQFKWISGETSSYTNWNPGEPNDALGNEDYAEILSNGKWNDNTASYTQRGIIEIKTNEWKGSQYLLTATGTWEQAQAEAKNLGGNLVTINSQEEQDWLFKNLLGGKLATLKGAGLQGQDLSFTFGGQQCWIGFTDKETEQQFKWISGETSSYTNWNLGEPNDNLGKEDYAEILSNGYWNDNTASYTQRGIIEIKTNNYCDTLTGGIGKDTLTGGLGADRFDYRTLADSILNSFDVITDFNANDGVDLFLVSTARSVFNNVGTVATLDTAGISAKLINTTFTANSAAQFIFGSRIFVAINDATAGFNATTDAIIEVTGLTGTLGTNNFTTTLA